MGSPGIGNGSGIGASAGATNHDGDDAATDGDGTSISGDPACGTTAIACFCDGVNDGAPEEISGELADPAIAPVRGGPLPDHRPANTADNLRVGE